MSKFTCSESDWIPCRPLAASPQIPSVNTVGPGDVPSSDCKDTVCPLTISICVYGNDWCRRKRSLNKTEMLSCTCTLAHTGTHLNTSMTWMCPAAKVSVATRWILNINLVARRCLKSTGEVLSIYFHPVGIQEADKHPCCVNKHVRVSLRALKFMSMSCSRYHCTVKKDLKHIFEEKVKVFC